MSDGKKKITVFFNTNHAVEYDRDKVAFKGSDASFFTFSESYQEEDYYAKLLDDGRALVNWDNVCYVRESVKRNELDDD